MSSFYHKASFLFSAAKLSQLPLDEGYEVAFAGRSNAGKSSALNVITQNRSLAKTSKTPGRTQLINLFGLDDERRLVDLPGYGYAKVSHETKERWQATLAQYLETRLCLRGLMLLMDIRHPFKELDQAMIQWAFSRDLPVHILLTKSDKFSRGPALQILKNVTQDLEELGLADNISVQLFSSQTRQGLDEACVVLDRWMERDCKIQPISIE